MGYGADRIRGHSRCYCGNFRLGHLTQGRSPSRGLIGIDPDHPLGCSPIVCDTQSFGRGPRMIHYLAVAAIVLVGAITIASMGGWFGE
jgi:hypothetical protein